MKFTGRILYPSLMVLVFCLSQNTAHAEIYKWVDKDGKVHFSDHKPVDQHKKSYGVEKVEPESVVSSSTHTSVQYVETATPKSYEGNPPSKRVLLEYVTIRLTGHDLSQNPVVGKAYRLTSSTSYVRRPRSRRRRNKVSYGVQTPQRCRADGDLYLHNAKYIAKSTPFKQYFYSVFETYGYATAVDTQKRFSRQEVSSPDLSVGATVVEVSLQHCGPSHTIQAITKNATYVKVKWEVFDNLQRQVVYSTVTEGSHDAFHSDGIQQGAAKSLAKAFTGAVNNLLATPAFVTLLHGRDTEQRAAVTTPHVAINVKHGDRNKDFTAKIGTIKAGTVTVRTPSGHGSGFVLSDDGYIITNYHVIAGSRTVLVLTEKAEYQAAVIHYNAARDVALLKVTDEHDLQPLPLSRTAAILSETLYVIGTPLSEELSFSITKGILSAQRMIDKKRFYQTDASVTHGNSGGPVFNQYGNVIAITVSGIEGGAVNINYLIPIEDVLDALGIPAT